MIAGLLTLAMAFPVLTPASPRLFGASTVGWHHDPFTMMEVWSQPLMVTPYFQPVTDLPARWLVRATDRVQAYNWLVLLSFPLAALAAHALARHLAIGRLGGAVAALIFAFSPFHLAHAAYHPHVAQVQWVALYVLALWHAIQRGTAAALAGLILAALAVVLSNFYAGFSVALLTPVLVGAGWWMTRAHAGTPARIAGVVAALAVTVTAGLTVVAWRAPALLVEGAAVAAPSEDVVRYSARAMSYLVPPVVHPIAGPAVARVWSRAGVDVALLEHQVTLGAGVLLLAAVGAIAWIRNREPLTPLPVVPALFVVGAAAAVLSASPGLVIGSGLHGAAPMFRSYARFGVVVQLMAALLAGIGVTTLWRRRTAGARVACAALGLLVAGEYAVAPAALSRSVWPTEAHRWVHDQTDAVSVLECAPEGPAAAGAAWLTKRRLTRLQGPFADCGEPGLGDKLAATGFTHLLIAHDAADAPDFRAGQAPEGLRLAAQYPSVALWTVTAPHPLVYVESLTGWFDRERHPTAPAPSWRWMGAEATWTIVSTSHDPIRVQLELEWWAFHDARAIAVALDAKDLGTLVVPATRHRQPLPVVVLSPGPHTVTFRAVDRPDRPADLGPVADQRLLSVAIGRWRWSTPKGGV